MEVAPGSPPAIDTDSSSRSTIDRLLPGLTLVRSYDRSWLRGDVLAGLTIWALVIPQGLAYGQLAGLPPITGLYVAIAGSLAYAVFGTSRYLNTGPESSVAMIIAVEMAPLAGGSPKRYAALSAMLALLVAGFLLLGFVARLGVITRLLSSPVLMGYLAGSGVVIVISQLAKATGIKATGRSPTVLGDLVRHADTVNWSAVGISLGTAAAFLLIHRYLPKVPPGLTVLILATVFVSLTGLSDTVAVVGDVPAGLPLPSVPRASLADIRDLMGPAVSIALLVFASSILTARGLANRDREEVNANNEFIALGAANLAAGLFHGFPANGSDSRSFAAANNGARSQLTGVVVAAFTIVTLLFLTPLIHDLPSAALGVVVILTAIKLIDVRAARRLLRIRPSDFILALVTFAGVLVLGVLPGIAFGVGVSLVEVLRRAILPHTAVLGRLQGIPTYRDIESFEDAETIPGLIVFRFDAPLFFANADAFRDQILRLVDRASPKVLEVIVDAESIYDIDTTGIEIIVRLHQDLLERDVRLVFARLKAAPREMMRRTGLDAVLGADAFTLRVEDAAVAYLDRAASRPQPEEVPPEREDPRPA